jgi:hypothetical protein
MAPLLALAPRAIFALGVVAALSLALTTRSVLRAWGRSPAWALLVLAHPTIIILSRTAMVDVWQAAAALGAWWSLRRGRRATVAWLVLLAVLKATGPVLVFGVVAGEVITSFAALRARDPQALRRLRIALGGAALAAVALGAMNYLGAGTVRSAYNHDFLSTPPFWYTYVPLRAPVHLATLLLNPPLLAAGAWALWRHGERGATLLALGFVALMCAYFFVDTGATRVESLVLSPRLILPSVAFLLVGYVALLDGAVARVRAPLPAWGAAAIVAVVLGTTTAVSVAHHRQQRDEAAVLGFASALAQARGGTLGVTDNAAKPGLMHRGHTTLFDAQSNRTPVVLCSELSASHRAPEGHFSCELPGYRSAMARGGFFALVRDDAAP